MKYIITRLDYNTVKAQVEGYYPLKGTYENFFKELIEYMNRSGFVKTVTYNNHSIKMEKLDPEFGFLYTDEYVLDGLLENDARFTEYLSFFLSKYEGKKKDLESAVEERIAKRNLHIEVIGKAKKIYRKYCETGEIEQIDDPEIARRVISMFKNQDSRVYTSISYTMEGDITLGNEVNFNETNIKALKVATGVSGIATGALGIATLAISSPVTFAIGIVTGVGCYCANRKQKELTKEKAKEVLNELADIYSNMYPEESTEQILTKK